MRFLALLLEQEATFIHICACADAPLALAKSEPVSTWVAPKWCSPQNISAIILWLCARAARRFILWILDS